MGSDVSVWVDKTAEGPLIPALSAHLLVVTLPSEPLVQPADRARASSRYVHHGSPAHQGIEALVNHCIADPRAALMAEDRRTIIEKVRLGRARLGQNSPDH